MAHMTTEQTKAMFASHFNNFNLSAKRLFLKDISASKNKDADSNKRFSELSPVVQNSVENRLRAIKLKAQKSRKDVCGVCGTEFKDKGACRVCDAEDERRAMNWSTMTIEQRERFFRRHGLENVFSIKEQAKLPFSKLTNHWQEELKKDGFGK